MTKFAIIISSLYEDEVCKRGNLSVKVSLKYLISRAHECLVTNVFTRISGALK